MTHQEVPEGDSPDDLLNKSAHNILPDWWHCYGGEADGLWMSVIAGPTNSGPDDLKPYNGEPVKDPMLLEGPSGSVSLDYITSWDHEPSEEEKREATPERWRDAEVEAVGVGTVGKPGEGEPAPYGSGHRFRDLLEALGFAIRYDETQQWWWMEPERGPRRRATPEETMMWSLLNLPESEWNTGLAEHRANLRDPQPEFSLQTMINEIKEHAANFPTHGAGCACMDRHSRALRKALAVVPLGTFLHDADPVEFKAQQHLQHVVNLAVRR